MGIIRISIQAKLKLLNIEVAFGQTKLTKLLKLNQHRIIAFDAVWPTEKINNISSVD